jgi:hypothetical protein
LKLLLPPQAKLIQILASSLGAEGLQMRINTAAYQLTGTMIHPRTVDKNVN